MYVYICKIVGVCQREREIIYTRLILILTLNENASQYFSMHVY